MGKGVFDMKASIARRLDVGVLVMTAECERGETTLER